MLAVLPLVGGILLGWFASRGVAILVQLLFVAIASAVLINTAPDHGHTSASMWWIVPALAALGALSLAVGFWIAGRRAGKAVPTT
jgi:hypothetical protein